MNVSVVGTFYLVSGIRNGSKDTMYRTIQQYPIFSANTFPGTWCAIHHYIRCNGFARSWFRCTWYRIYSYHGSRLSPSTHTSSPTGTARCQVPRNVWCHVDIISIRDQWSIRIPGVPAWSRRSQIKLMGTLTIHPVVEDVHSQPLHNFQCQR